MYDRNNALAAADMLQDRVLPFFEQHSLPLLRVLTDRGTEFWGAPEPSSLETNGSCERFHRTIQEAFYAGAFTKKSYSTL
ncbi:MAG: hypothetical protein ICV84_03300 [Flavisolibacter sp.]|nr:hypothetical protein [Flavisolibacter sp.]